MLDHVTGVEVADQDILETIAAIHVNETQNGKARQVTSQRLQLGAQNLVQPQVVRIISIMYENEGKLPINTIVTHHCIHRPEIATNRMTLTTNPSSKHHRKSKSHTS